MGGKDNLIQYQGLSREEVLAVNSKGGKNSGAKRREIARSRKAAQMWLDLNVKDQSLEEYLTAVGISEEEQNNRVAVIAVQGQKALEGDVIAAKFIIDLAGENASQELRREEFEYLKDKEAGIISETEDLTEIEEEIYGGDSDGGQ